MQLASSCWPDLVGRVEVALFPLGSCEQHGPHLPFVTDATVADAVSRAAVSALAASGLGAVAAPVLAYGASGEHQHFPGTVSIGHQALEHVLLELGRSATTWTARLVFVNGHGGNLPTVITAVRTLRSEGRDVGWVPCAPADADAHAGRTETSLMHALAPASVRAGDAEAGSTEPIERLLPLLRVAGVAAVSRNGVLGDPAGATVAEGFRLLGELVEDTIASIRSWTVSPDGRLAQPQAVRV